MLKWFKKKESPETAESARATATTAEAASGEAASGEGLFARLKRGLGRTQNALAGRLREAIGLKQKVDEELLEKIEEILIQGDVGFAAAERVIERLREEGRKRSAYEAEALTAVVKESIAEILMNGQREMRTAAEPPTVILIVGVNGTGKTTTIGKLALEFARAEKRVMLVAADTFRAAAVEQLAIWAERTGAGLVRQNEGADPASVCFEGLEAARRDRPDVVMIDTAGRLHTKTHLMDELGKVVRVIKKHLPEAPHETLLVLDATTGQNALNQVKIFKEAVEVSGLIMTKLDGTAKGGILVAIKQAHPELPVMKIGIGERADDLRDFDARDFADALFAEEDH
jgi:fused signal recognition particle receptor